MKEKITPCLAHGLEPREHCEKREQCARYLSLRQRQFPDGDVTIGSACVKMDYALFVPVGVGK